MHICLSPKLSAFPLSHAAPCVPSSWSSLALLPYSTKFHLYQAPKSKAVSYTVSNIRLEGMPLNGTDNILPHSFIIWLKVLRFFLTKNVLMNTLLIILLTESMSLFQTSSCLELLNLHPLTFSLLIFSLLLGKFMSQQMGDSCVPLTFW